MDQAHSLMPARGSNRCKDTKRIHLKGKFPGESGLAEDQNIKPVWPLQRQEMTGVTVVQLQLKDV